MLKKGDNKKKVLYFIVSNVLVEHFNRFPYLAWIQLSFYIMVVSFIAGVNGTTRRRQTNCCKSLTNIVTSCTPGYWVGNELAVYVVIGTDCIS
jgi:hypothetical protein